jgi:hypothetical protein
MAETLGLIASVIQVAGAGLKLSQTLYQYVDGVATADRRIQDIAKEIELTSFVIEELGGIFKNDETSSLISKNAVKTANETMKECSTVFTEIDATLKKSRKNTLGRLMLPFRDNKIEVLRNHIDKLKSTLQLLMQVLTYAHQVAAKKLDSKAAAKQKAQIQELIELEKESTRKYEASRRKFSLSESSTLNSDRSVVLDDNDKSSISTHDITVAAAAMGSTINLKTLDTCVRHVRMLLENIENLQQAFTNEIDGDDHSQHHQNLIGSYFRARDHLDSVLFSGSDNPGEKIATPNGSALTLGEYKTYTKNANTNSLPSVDLGTENEARGASRVSKLRSVRWAHRGRPSPPASIDLEEDEWAYSDRKTLDSARPARSSVDLYLTRSEDNRIEAQRPLPRRNVYSEGEYRSHYGRRTHEYLTPEPYYATGLHRARTRADGRAPAPNVTIYNTTRMDNESSPNVRTEHRDTSAGRTRPIPSEWCLEDQIAELQLEIRRDSRSRSRSRSRDRNEYHQHDYSPHRADPRDYEDRIKLLLARQRLKEAEEELERERREDEIERRRDYRHHDHLPHNVDPCDDNDKIKLLLAQQRLKEAEDKLERERREDELERREDLIRRKLEIKYIKERAERDTAEDRHTEEDRIVLQEDRLRREWELKRRREESKREQRTRDAQERAMRTIAEDRARTSTEKRGREEEQQTELKFEVRRDAVTRAWDTSIDNSRTKPFTSSSMRGHRQVHKKQIPEIEVAEPQGSGRRRRRKAARRRSDSSTDNGARHRQRHTAYEDSSGSDYDYYDEWKPGYRTSRPAALQERFSISPQRAEMRRSNAPQLTTAATDDGASRLKRTSLSPADVRDDVDPSVIPLPPSPLLPLPSGLPLGIPMRLSIEEQDSESSRVSDESTILLGSEDEEKIDGHNEDEGRQPNLFNRPDDAHDLDYDSSHVAESTHFDAPDDLGSTSPTSTRLDEVDELLKDWTTVF